MAKMRHLVALAKIPATLEYVDEFVEDTDRKTGRVRSSQGRAGNSLRGTEREVRRGISRSASSTRR